MLSIRARANLIQVSALVVAALLGGGFAHWVGTWQPRTITADLYALQAVPLINGRLQEAERGYVFLAGDSHAEMVNATYRLCGKEVVNGGVSGAGAALYRDLVKRMAFRTPPDAIVLTIGTNDILRKKDPLSEGRLAEFEANVTQILKSLSVKTRRVVMTPLPPVGRELAGKVQIEAVAAYSERLRRLCEHEACIFVDPFLDSREADGSTARPGAMRDGLHMVSYRAVSANLGQSLCPGGTL